MWNPHDNEKLAHSKTLIDVLQYWAVTAPEKSAYIFLQDGEVAEQTINYAQLDKRARVIAAELIARNVCGHCAMLLYPSSLEYICAFLGCLYAGVIAIPVYPPRGNAADARLEAILKDSKAALVMSCKEIFDKHASKLKNVSNLISLPRLITDTLDLQDAPIDLNGRMREQAFVQYTSGSTSQPKGVVLTHANILYNEAMLCHGFAQNHDSIWVSWLPLFHDMGLLANVLQTLYLGATCVLMAPGAFIQKPFRWLKAISKYKATASGGPNFCYDLCASKVTTAQREQLDLSSWTLAFNGAEPIRAKTLKTFSKIFEACGFVETAFFPCYGLAEACVFVTGGKIEAPPKIFAADKNSLENQHLAVCAAPTDHPRFIVGCGMTWLDQKIVIVDPSTRMPKADGGIGEIWISGPNVAKGYWGHADRHGDVFAATLAHHDNCNYLRTGDLGFLHAGQLYVTGRLKDLIIIRGQNHYPQDLEFTAENCHPSLKHSSNAAFSVETDGKERLVIVQEVLRTWIKKLDVDEIVATMRDAVAEQHGLMLDVVVLIKTATIAKTSSGKIQRQECLSRFLRNDLSVVGMVKPIAIDSSSYLKQGSGHRGHLTEATISAWLVNRLAGALACSATGIANHRPFSYYGLDSAASVTISGEIAQWLDKPIPITILYDYPTIELLAKYLAGGVQLTSTAQIDERIAPPQPRLAGKIAIIGMACRFPGASDLAQFWSLLSRGGDAVSDIPQKRTDMYKFFGENNPMPESIKKWTGGFLVDIDKFDPLFFSISPAEATAIDPQQRILLETAYHAFADAGLDLATATARTGVFIGISGSDYQRILFNNPHAIDRYAATGGALSIAANRISYAFGFDGPSMAVDTACSSSLTAVHLACNSIREGQARIALAGGVNLLLAPEITLSLAKVGVISPSGSCKPFAADADGIVRSEGCGIVVLKSLEQALSDDDRIYGVISGSGVNQDGRSNGLMAPKQNSQEMLLTDVYQRAGINPADVDYIEAHGTGTFIGDPIEVKALGNVLRKARQVDCAIGSVKGNLGHLEAAAGIAGLIKTALMLHYRELVPTLNCKAKNPNIPFDELKIKVQTENSPWWSLDKKQIAGVNSFGFGGTNVHVILESRPETVAKQQIQQDEFGKDGDSQRPLILPLSAHTPLVLQHYIRSYREFLRNHIDGDAGFLRSMCHTAALRRNFFDFRIDFVFSSRDELLSQLEYQLDNELFAGELASIDTSQVRSSCAADVVFVFSGHGAYWPGVGRELLVSEPLFRKKILQCQQIMSDYVDWSVVDTIENASQTTSIDRIFAATFAIQVAIVDLWKQYSITPAAVVGHSGGEVAAAYCAGSLDLPAAIAVVIHRGNQLLKVSGLGMTVALELSLSNTRRLLSVCGSEIAIAAINGPEAIVVSGVVAVMEVFIERLQKENIDYKVLQLAGIAVHSPLVESGKQALKCLLKEINPKKSKVDFYSTVVGKKLSGEELNADYWADNIRETVVFADTIEALLQDNQRIFLEIGPHPALGGAINALLKKHHLAGLTVASLRRDEVEHVSLLKALGELYCYGFPVDFAAVYRDKIPWMSLPVYPFQRESFWFREAQTGAYDQKNRWDYTVTMAQRRAGSVPFDLQLHTYAQKWSELNKLSSLYIFAALQEIGIITLSGRVDVAQNGYDKMGILPCYHHLVSLWVRRMESEGYAMVAERGYAVEGVQPEGALAVLLQNAKNTFADIPILLEYVVSCGKNLQQIITGQIPALETLFPGGSFKIANFLYKDWAVARYFNDIVTEIVKSVVIQNRTSLRILEIGAGSGATAAAVLSALSNAHVTYYFTDVSDLFLQRAKASFKSYPFVKYALLDIENIADNSVIAPASFDIVLASNVLHATRDISLAIKNVRSLLTTGGVLVLYETTTHWAWFETSTGLIEGWQLFRDNVRNTVPLLSDSEWKDILLAHGFKKVVCFPNHENIGNELGQHVILASTASDIRFGERFAESGEQPFEVQERNQDQSDKLSLYLDKISNDPEERSVSMQKYVCLQASHILRIPSDQVDVGKPLRNMGLDSLMAISLKNRIEADIGVRLANDDLFREIEHVTEKLIEGYGQTEKGQHSTQSLADKGGSIPLSPAQCWFFEHQLENPSHWNVTQVLEFTGARMDFLKTSIRSVIEQQEVFNLRFFPSESGWQANVVKDDSAMMIDEFNCGVCLAQWDREDAIGKKVATLQAQLDISKGPLARAVVLRFEDAVLVVMMVHHLLFDGGSWLVLLNDVEKNYRKLGDGERCGLAPNHDYYVWNSGLQQYLQHMDVVGELDYWINVHHSYSAELLLDFPEGIWHEESAGNIQFCLTEQETQYLITDFGNATGVEIFEAMLFAIQVGFCREMGMANLLLETERHGRNSMVPGVDLERTIGWFNTFFPVLLQNDNNSSRHDGIHALIKSIRAIPQEGHNYALLRYISDQFDKAKLLKSLPQADVKFIYHGHLYDQIDRHSLFKLSDFVFGSNYGSKNIAKHIIYLYFFVKKGCLNMEVVYSKNIHRHATILQLAKRIMAELREVMKL